ncbi:hypothetical protein, conserved [Plasmodium vivax]|uniref:VIR protein n=1 Tax=Plasmodium vivax TaxID=5855 RepID=A0A1G4E4H6_PLAVI|nr:hypothetical protein, conserved [Plasmodium vivax]
MNSGNLRTIPIRVDVFLDQYSSFRKLPAEKRNVEIISNIDFINILRYPLNQNKKDINSWVDQYENKLNNFLHNYKDKIVKDDLSVYCRNINYLIDIIVQRIRMFKGIEQIEWENKIERTSIKVLSNNPWLKCERNFDNHKNRYVYVKKMMFDLCEDIDYIMKDVNLLNHKRCYNVIKRIKYRKDTLKKIYNSFNDGINYFFDNHCTISDIMNKFEKLKCKPKAKPTEVIPDNKDTILNQTETDVHEHQEDEIRGDVVPPTDVGDLESLSVELDLNEDSQKQPKLDTTYAAASLAGISLFGTILYKYRPFGLGSNLRRGARNGSNIFPIDNSVYDGNIMNNFEYLQTGIASDEYQVGYSSVTDY